MSVHRNLALKRATLNLTQKDLSDKTGIAQSYIARLEKGEFKNPRKETLEKLAAAMGTTVNWLEKYAPTQSYKEDITNILPKLNEGQLRILYLLANELSKVNQTDAG